MDKSELLEELYQAIELVEEAKSRVDEVAKALGEYSRYKAYGCYGFDTLLGNGNPYDASLFDLVKKAEDMMEEEVSNK
jgi:hypothetical protein